VDEHLHARLLEISKQEPTATASYRYEDALAKTAAGWQFKRRVLHRDAAAAMP